MILEVNGVQYRNFVRAECEIRLDSLSNRFSFEAIAPEGVALPFKGGDICTIIVADQKVLTGAIEYIGVDYDASNHILTIAGRDKTADLVDSTIDIMDSLNAESLTLKKVIEIVIEKIGLDIKVFDEVNPLPFNAAEDIIEAEPGQNAFNLIETYAKKRQVLLTSNSNGDIVITSNSGVAGDGAIQNILNSTDNNVIKASFTLDTTNRYKTYKLVSSLNPVASNASGSTDLALLVNQGGRVQDPDIERERQLVIVSDIPLSDEECIKRGEWEADIRRARGLSYSAVVPGYQVGVDDGELWQINKIYQIVDDFIGKVEPMLCNSVLYSLDLESGSTTSLAFVGKDAYKQFPPVDERIKVAENVK